MTEIISHMKEFAIKAGERILDYYDISGNISKNKKEFSHFVTDADKESEKIIVNGLKDVYPDAGIMAEEGSRIKGEGCFIIDPLDGTHNFMHGIPHFCVSIGYVEDSKVKAGVIYDPVKEECFSAEKEKGAFLNEDKISPSANRKPEEAMVTIGIPPPAYHLRGKIMDALKNLIMKVNSLRLPGSAALNLAYVASGRIDGDIEFGLSPWDVAAGSIIVEEAKAKITDEKGGSEIMDGNIIAASPGIYNYLLDFVQKNIIKSEKENKC